MKKLGMSIAILLLSIKVLAGAGFDDELNCYNGLIEADVNAVHDSPVFILPGEYNEEFLFIQVLESNKSNEMNGLDLYMFANKSDVYHFQIPKGQPPNGTMDGDEFYSFVIETPIKKPYYIRSNATGVQSITRLKLKESDPYYRLPEGANYYNLQGGYKLQGEADLINRAREIFHNVLKRAVKPVFKEFIRHKEEGRENSFQIFRRRIGYISSLEVCAEVEEISKEVKEVLAKFRSY